MVSKVLGAALGGLVATEALGITNFSGGQQMPGPATIIDTGGGTQAIPIPTGGGGQNNPVQTTKETVTRVVGGSGETSRNMGKLLNQVRNQQSQIEKLKNQSQDVNPIQIIKDATPDPGNSNSPTVGGGGGNQGSDFKLQDLANPNQGMQVGDIPAMIGEGGVAAGSTVDDIKGGIGSPAAYVGDKPKEGSFFGSVYEAGQGTGEVLNNAREGRKELEETIGGFL